MAIDSSGLDDPGAPSGSGERQVQSVEQDPTQHRGGDDADESHPTSRGDTFSLTQIAARLKQMEQSLANLPAVDQERIEGVRKALVNGAYAIDAERIAGKILAFEQGLGGKP